MEIITVITLSITGTITNVPYAKPKIKEVDISCGTSVVKTEAVN